MSKQKTSRSDDQEPEPEVKRPRLDDNKCSFIDYGAGCENKTFASFYGKYYCHLHYGIMRINLLSWTVIKDPGNTKCFHIDGGVDTCQEKPYGMINEKFLYCRKHLSMVLSNICPKNFIFEHTPMNPVNQPSAPAARPTATADQIFDGLSAIRNTVTITPPNNPKK